MEQAVLIGDRRRYCSLLVVPAFDALLQWAEDRGIQTDSVSDLVAYPEVLKGVEEELFAMLLGLLQQGPRQVLGVVNAPGRDLVNLLKNYETKLAESGE